jgi:cytoskeletal protein RodZ
LYASYLGVNPRDLLEPSEPVVETAEPVKLEETISEKPTEPKAEPEIQAKKPLKKPVKSKPVEMPIPEKPSDILFKEIGKELQKQRESLGLSRSDIERQIKIRELYLFALENGQIEDLPSSVQGRGMLNNYATFMSLDPEPLQMRFAEGLQLRRLEKVAEEAEKKKSPEIKKYNSPITGWRRYMTPDVLVGGSVFIVLFVLIIWGALQVIGTAHLQPMPTENSIANILIGTETPTAPVEQLTPQGSLTATSTGEGPANTASVNLLATITAIGNKPIQVVVVAYQRAFLKVVSDGKQVFLGRTVPGVPYPFTGSIKISLTTGNAAALQIYYNQQDLGILGGYGQVLNLDFTANTMVTETPQFTAIPTATFYPTYTQQPTETPTITPTPELPTITPYRP